jgi:DNA-binding MarR family transcriptional regulator
MKMLASDFVAASNVLDCLPSLRRALGTEVAAGPGGATITVTKFYALRALAERDRTAGDLARSIVVTLPTLTQLVDGLVEQEWVERYPDASDRRKVWLRLSEKGRELYGHAREAAEQRVADTMAHLSEHEREALVEGLEAFRAALHAQRQERQPRAEHKHRA